MTDEIAPLAVPEIAAATGELKHLAHPLSAGFPSPAADYVEAPLDLNSYLVRNRPATFLFTVRGQSMIGAAIDDGDILVVDRSVTPRQRAIVVAVVDGEFTVKRYVTHAGRPALQPENPDFDVIVFGEGTSRSLEIWGVVVGVVRRL